MSKASKSIRRFLKHNTSVCIQSVPEANGEMHGLWTVDLRALLDERDVLHDMWKMDAYGTPEAWRHQQKERDHWKAEAARKDAELAAVREELAVRDAAPKSEPLHSTTHHDVVAALQDLLNRSNSVDSITIDRQLAWQLLRRAKAEPLTAANRGLKLALSGGVGEIARARAYQKRCYSDVHAPELLHTAALALLLDSEVLYPRQWNTRAQFQKMRNRGRKEQLAHAGACIAALIDRLPSAPPRQPEFKLSPSAGSIEFAPEN